MIQEEENREALLIETTAIPIAMYEFVMGALEAGKPKPSFHEYLAQLNYPSISKLYEDADKDGDGKLDLQEVRECLMSQRLTTTDRAMKFAMERNKLITRYDFKHNAITNDGIEPLVEILNECNHVGFIGVSEWIEGETFTLPTDAMAKNSKKGKKGKKKK